MLYENKIFMSTLYKNEIFINASYENLNNSLNYYTIKLHDRFNRILMVMIINKVIC